MQNQSMLGSMASQYAPSAPVAPKKPSKARIVLTHQMLRAIKNSPKGVIPRGLAQKVNKRKKLNKKSC
jgi:hypothetical protein